MENVIIQASAGTGKTHQLACRYLLLLFSGVRPENILATTFTKKAAGEILNRILSWMAIGALNEDNCQKLAKALSDAKKMTQREDTSPVELTLETVRKTLYEVIKCLNRVNISTLDSYFNQRAQCFSLELELPMDWQIMEDAQDEMYRQAALSTLFQDEDVVYRYTQFIKDSELKRSVFEQMLSSVENLYALWREAPQKAWDALLVPRIALNEEAFQSLLSKTFLLLDADKALTDNDKAGLFGDLNGLRKPQTRFDAALRFFGHAFSKKVIGIFQSPESGIAMSSKRTIDNSETIDCLIQLVQYLIAFVKDVWKKQSDFYRDTIKDFDALYTDSKKKSGQLRFDDVPWLLTLDSFVKRQLSDSFRMDSSIRHLMLDEFQDTSLAQWRVLESLARQTSKDKNSSFFCVGDAKQAIYGWRGGEAQLLGSIPRLLRPGVINESIMSESRRSGPAIMQVVNELFMNVDSNQLVAKKSAGKNEPQPMISGAKDWRDKRFTEHKSHPSLQNLPSYVELCTAPYSEDASKEDKDKTEKLRAMTYEYTARRVKDLYEQTEELGLSIGVLVRKNDVGASIADCIKKLGLECSLEGKSPLLDSYEVCQILALMKWVDHPGDVYSYFQVSQSTLAQSLGVKDRWNTSRDDKQRMKVVFEDCEILNKIRYDLFRDGYGITVQRWVEKLKPEANPRSRRRLEMLEELANKYDSQGSTRTDDFISYIETASVADSFKARIRIMTYHQSKGLEFDIVVLPQLDAQLVSYDSIPVVFGRPDPVKQPNEIIRYVKSDYRFLLPQNQQELFIGSEEKQMQESLCNLYVAMTRARQGLYMILPPPKTGKLGTNKTYEDVLLGTLGNVTDKKTKEENKVYYTAGDENWIRNTPLKEDKEKAPPIEAVQSGNERSEGEPVLPTFGETLEVGGAFEFKEGGRSVFVPLPASAWKTSAKPMSFVNVITAEVDNAEFSGSTLIQSSRGSLFHYWLSDIEWIEDYSVDDQRLIDMGIETGLQKDSFVDLLPAFKSLLKHPNVISTLKRLDESWETHREKPVAGILNDEQNERLVSGVIDRLTLHRTDGKVDKAIIVDFKTVRTRDDIAEVRNRYAGQMDAYRQIISQTYRIPVSSIETTLLILEGNF